MKPRGRWSRRAVRALLGLLLLTAIGYGLFVLTILLWPPRVHLPQVPLPLPGQPVLVVSPHEDDETLGGEAYMREAVARGAPVWVCLMTCGEGEELGTAWVTHRPLPSAKEFVRLGKIRQCESLRALAAIGVPADHVIFLGYPNMGLRWMWSAQYWSPTHLWKSPYTKTDHSPFEDSLTPQAPFCGAAALADLKTVMDRVRPRIILTTGPADIHPDHWATYCFTKLALRELQTESRQLRETDLLTFLVHRRGWPEPWGYYPALELPPPRALADLPIMQWQQLELTSSQTAAKNRIIFSYRSQVPAFDLLLRSFARRNEPFARIADVPMLEEPEALAREPRRENEYLRLYPRFDLRSVSATGEGGRLTVSIQTGAPLRGADLIMLLTVVKPGPGEMRAVQVQIHPGKSTVTRVATDTSGPTLVSGSDIVVQRQGAIMKVGLPAIWFAGRDFMVDALVFVRGRMADHSITRLITRPGTQHLRNTTYPESR